MTDSPDLGGCPEKLPTDELKIRAYKSYCAHIAAGYPQNSWYFDEEGITLVWNTIENYFKRYPELCVAGGIFDPVHKEIARAKNYQGWFDVTRGSAKGLNEKANTASLQMIMRNIHKWDAKEKESTTPPNESNIGLIQSLIEQVESQKKELNDLKSKTTPVDTRGE